MASLSKKPSVPKVVVLVLLGLYSLFLLWQIASGIDKRYQWDFKTYYCAAHVAEMGLNYYDQPNLHHFCSPTVQQYYNYTPLSIWFFRFFNLFDYPTAYLLFFILKVLALAGLFFLWKKIFLETEGDLGFFVFALLAFNNALYVDLLTGNISLFEQLGLWLGFFFLLRRRLFLFGLCVVVIANFKVVPLAFLILLLFQEEKKKHLHFFGWLASFLGLQALSFVLSPFLFKEFLRVFFTMLRETRGILNPSTYVWLQNIIRSYYPRVLGAPAPVLLSYAVFALLAAIIIWLTGRALGRLKRRGGLETEKVAIFLSCTAYALLLPRFKDYSYVLLLVPAYFALKKYSGGLGRVFLFGLMILSIPEYVNLPGLKDVFEQVWGFMSMWAAVVIWILYLRHAFSLNKIQTSSPPLY
ncbi:MAG: glycosyltransferase family 87 protein [Candidatus Aminicenantales bacterium]|jgi:hypothetical protein